jgi:hypothetical protein
VMVPSTKHALPLTISIASWAVGTNSLRTVSITGINAATYLDICSLRDFPQVTQKFLCTVLPKIHARALRRLIQAAGLRSAGLFVPRLSQGVPDQGYAKIDLCVAPVADREELGFDGPLLGKHSAGVR